MVASYTEVLCIHVTNIFKFVELWWYFGGTLLYLWKLSSESDVCSDKEMCLGQLNERW